MEFERIIEGLKQLPEVSAICLGGSRASGLCDLKSDYDVYVYYKDRISLSKRREILSPNCTHTEIGVNYFEEEDDCVMNNGVVIELIYRSLADFEKLVDDTLTSSNASLGYSTCFFDNILHAKPLYDREGAYRNMAEKLRVYPEELRQNIIKKNTEMLHGVIASYDAQILKAYGRGDKVSVNHRIAAYLASYFDVIFALNKIYHPGEKRLVETVKSKCAKVPADFEKNINALLGCENLEETLNSMYNNLKILL